MSDLPVGIYEQPLDQELQELLLAHPELKSVLRSIDDESAPHTYAQFVGRLLSQALRITSKEYRVELINRVIDLLAATDGLEYLTRKRLLSDSKNLLMQVGADTSGLSRPQTPLATSMLMTGQGADPPLEHELRAEMATADGVDILVSFIKWSGLRLLKPAFERLRDARVPVRALSTSYMGASDPAALKWLARLENVSVRIS